ncbi:MAG: hypothetical protein M3464_15165 [Chloroflexota bacterium]|nr:hypothetical protein [Chloroflexota bacterium]
MLAPMLARAAFVAAGYPIGSGCVESAHTTVLQARLKRGGMHWHPAVLPAMIEPRVVLANERWDEVWPQIAPQRRRQRQARRTARRQGRWRTPIRPKLVHHGKPTAAHPWRRPFRRRPSAAATKM